MLKKLLLKFKNLKDKSENNIINKEIICSNSNSLGYANDLSLISEKNNQTTPINNNDNLDTCKVENTNTDSIIIDNNIGCTQSKEKFIHIKDFYYSNFVNCKSLNEVLYMYINITPYSELFNSLRLRYLNMFLFNKAIINTKYTTQELTHILKIAITDVADNNKLITNNTIAEAKNNNHVSKIKENFLQLKNFYYNNFNECNSLSEILTKYISITNPEELFDNSKLRCLNMFLFHKGIIDNKYTIEQLHNLINSAKNENFSNINVSNQHNCIDTNSYNSLKHWIQQSIKNQNLFNNDISLNKVLVSLVSKFGYFQIQDNNYLESIYNILIDQEEVNFNINSIDTLINMLDNILFLENIHFWDSEEEKIYNCTATFEGKYITIEYDDSFTDITLPEKGLINIICEKVNNVNINEYTLSIENNCFIVDETNKDIILSYYQTINNTLQDELKKDILMINQITETVSDNVAQIILNYLNYFPHNILLNRENYIVFEHLISFNNYYTKSIVNINEDQRNQAIDKIRNDKNYYNHLRSVVNDNYFKLVKVIKKYVDVPDEIHSSITWSLIQKYACKYYADMWTKDYGSYFNDILTKSFTELIDIYCHLDDINTKDINTIGIFTYYLMNNNKFEKIYNKNFLHCNEILINNILEECEKIDLESFENKLVKSNQQKATYSINDVDLMTGHEFEYFIGELFRLMGYSVEVTKGSGDQGIDVLVEKNRTKIGVQTKCYSNNVTNKAIQETVAGLKYYNCDKGIVITNNFYTKSAINLAQANNIILWDRNILQQKIEELFN